MGRERHRERKKREVKWNSNWKKNQYVLAFSVCSRIEIGLEWWDMSSWLQMVRTGVSDRDEGKSVYFRVIQYENVLISWFHTRCQVAGRGIIFVAAMQTHTHTYSIHLRRWRAGETKFCVSFILRNVTNGWWATQITRARTPICHYVHRNHNNKYLKYTLCWMRREQEKEKKNSSTENVPFWLWPPASLPPLLLMTNDSRSNSRWISTK